MNNFSEDSQYFKNLKSSGAFKEFMNRRTRKKFYVDYNNALLSNEVDELCEEIKKQGNLQHEVLILFILHTGIPASNLINIRLRDVNCNKCYLTVYSNKNQRNCVIPFSGFLKEKLELYMETMCNEKTEYLFESHQNRKYTLVRINGILSHYSSAMNRQRNISYRKLMATARDNLLRVT